MLVSPQDKSFEERIGGRMPENKTDPLGKEKPSLKEKAALAFSEGSELRAFNEGLGIPTQPVAPKEDDKIQGNVVSAVLVAMTGMNASLKDSVEGKEKEIAEARAHEDTTKQQFYQLQADALNAARTEMSTIMREIQAKNTPAAAIAGFKEFKSFFDELAPKPAAPADSGDRAARMVDNQTALKLEEMHQNHALAMKKIELEISGQQNAFQLQLIQFKEDSARRWEEYKDGRQLRGDALGGFQDLAAAIAAGIDKDRGVSARAGGATQTPPMEATLKQFRCQFCQTLVNVDDPEAASVACPNPECGTVFHLRGKG